MTAVRALTVGALLVLAVLLQVSALPVISIDGVVPDVVLLVVVAAALVRGTEFAMVTGFAGGLLLDLAPPADHVAGRWALALVVVGFVAGRVRQDAGRSLVGSIVTVAASSFVGTSIFMMSGLVIRDAAAPLDQALRVVPIALAYDVVLAIVLLPALLRVLRRIEPARAAYA